MTRTRYRFSNAATDFFFDGKFSSLPQLADRKNTILITDENVYKAHTKKFARWNTIVLKPGEAYKVQQTVDAIIDQLIEMGADRSTTLVGVGGGVITDITGYTASVYMRGIRFGFVPTTLLAMVDAAIGGKNGVDVGVYKNIAGTIRQPAFLLYDQSLLATLPLNEWQNGFAEIIKHAAIKDAAMFRALQQHDVAYYQRKKADCTALIKRNALIKIKVVQKDEYEKGDRKLLNFGHTLGHALENQYELSHGQAISIGMTYAAAFSAQLLGFTATEKLTTVLEQYGLPTYASFNAKKVIEVLKADKKKVKDVMQYILLEKIGKGTVQAIPIKQLQQMIGGVQ